MSISSSFLLHTAAIQQWVADGGTDKSGAPTGAWATVSGYSAVPCRWQPRALKGLGNDAGNSGTRQHAAGGFSTEDTIFMNIDYEAQISTDRRLLITGPGLSDNTPMRIITDENAAGADDHLSIEVRRESL